MKKLFIVPTMLCIVLGSLFSQEAGFTISTSYNNLLSNRYQTGMLDRIMIEAFRRLDIQARLVFTPTEKSLVDVDAGILDAELNRIEGMEQTYPNLVRVPEPNMTMHFVAFSRQNFEIDGWESIHGLNIGIVKGWKILENNTGDFPNVVLVSTEKELFNMLRKDRLEVALYSKLTGYAVLRDLGYDNEGIRHLEPPLASRDMFLYVHKDHAGLTEDIAAAIRSMKDDGTYERIVEEAVSSYMSDNE
ncbi:MAG: transporter substrate-binding domain-containing protein [Spirochaetota bacterium]|nr:transporter substrate-binding domain-containing protein [Spirochaetota bacterium]